MKIVIELIGGVITGIIASVILFIMDVELTTVQSVIIVGSIVAMTTIVSEVNTAINRKIEKKKHS